ncbi:MAG: histidine kinase, partial [Solobacterium sp.]|nr:histidine kinase [Solobacterium sp.]
PLSAIHELYSVVNEQDQWLLVTAAINKYFWRLNLIYYRYTDSIKEYSYSAIQNTLSSNVVNIEQKLFAVDTVSTQLITTLSQKHIIMHTDSSSDTKALYDSASTAFNDYTVMLQDHFEVEGFRNFYLYLSGCATILLSDYTAFDNVNYSDYDLHALPENRWGISVPLSSMLINPYNATLQSERNFAKNYSRKDSNDQDVILTACVKEQYINELLTENLNITPTYALILDSYGRPMSSMKQSEIGSFYPKYVSIFDRIQKSSPGVYSEITLNDTDYLLNYVHSDFNNWYCVIVTDCSSLLHNPLLIRPSVILLMICSLLIALLFTWLFYRWQQRTARKLANAIRAISSWATDRQLQKSSPSADVFSADPVLRGSLAELISSIDDISIQIEKQRTSSTSSEIRRLQTEINPHMIYNSLESVYSMARINGQDEIADLVMALSKYFRIALSGGRGSVPFRDAYELSKQYVIVQNIRMNYILAFHADIADDVWPVMVPKFLLQPVIENSIIHGFRNQRDNWKISIHAGFEEKRLRILISDSGSGLMETEVQDINQRLNDFNFESTTNNKGYALRNINYQLKTQYGEDSFIRVSSTYGEGTTVEIILDHCAS